MLVRVPGAFEIPSAARTLAETKKYDAIICIGCLLRGDTAHYDVIVNEVTRGIGQSAQETGVPHAFGVLTCETLEQAIDRAGLKMGNKGFEAALAAVEMANLGRASSARSSLVVGKAKPSLVVGRHSFGKARTRATAQALTLHICSTHRVSRPCTLKDQSRTTRLADSDCPWALDANHANWFCRCCFRRIWGSRRRRWCEEYLGGAQ